MYQFYVPISKNEGVHTVHVYIRSWSDVFKFTLTSDFEVWNFKGNSQFLFAQSNCEGIWSTSDIYFDGLNKIKIPPKLWKYHQN